MMSAGFILFVTVLHIIGKVRGGTRRLQGVRVRARGGGGTDAWASSPAEAHSGRRAAARGARDGRGLCEAVKVFFHAAEMMIFSDAPPASVRWGPFHPHPSDAAVDPRVEAGVPLPDADGAPAAGHRPPADPPQLERARPPGAGLATPQCGSRSFALHREVAPGCAQLAAAGRRVIRRGGRGAGGAGSSSRKEFAEPPLNARLPCPTPLRRRRLGPGGCWKA